MGACTHEHPGLTSSMQSVYRHKLYHHVDVSRSCVVSGLHRCSGMMAVANTYIHASKAYGAHASSLTGTTNDITVKVRSQDGLKGHARYAIAARLPLLLINDLHIGWARPDVSEYLPTKISTLAASTPYYHEHYLSKRGTCNGNLLNRCKQLLRRLAQVFLDDLGYVFICRDWAFVQHVISHGVHILHRQYVVLCSMHACSNNRIENCSDADRCGFNEGAAKEESIHSVQMQRDRIMAHCVSWP